MADEQSAVNQLIADQATLRAFNEIFNISEEEVENSYQESIVDGQARVNRLFDGQASVNQLIADNTRVEVFSEIFNGDGEDLEKLNQESTVDDSGVFESGSLCPGQDVSEGTLSGPEGNPERMKAGKAEPSNGEESHVASGVTTRGLGISHIQTGKYETQVATENLPLKVASVNPYEDNGGELPPSEAGPCDLPDLNNAMQESTLRDIAITKQEDIISTWETIGGPYQDPGTTPHKDLLTNGGSRGKKETVIRQSATARGQYAAVPMSDMVYQHAMQGATAGQQDDQNTTHGIDNAVLSFRQVVEAFHEIKVVQSAPQSPVSRRSHSVVAYTTSISGSVTAGLRQTLEQIEVEYGYRVDGTQSSRSGHTEQVSLVNRYQTLSDNESAQGSKNGYTKQPQKSSPLIPNAVQIAVDNSMENIRARSNSDPMQRRGQSRSTPLNPTHSSRSIGWWEYSVLPPIQK